MSELLSLFFRPRMLVVFLLGFSSGLPLALTGGTLQAWLTDAGIALPTIGRFALVGIPYTVKFLWAPLLDACAPPILGRRRGWALIAQGAVIASILAVGSCNPSENLALIAIFAFILVFASATQDIVLDALRTELLSESEYGAGAGMYVMGYRIAMLVSGALALYLADSVSGAAISWSSVYWIMAAVMSIGMITVICCPEPQVSLVLSSPDQGPIDKTAPRLRDRVLLPFIDFFRRPASMAIISFVTVYKLSTMMATALTVTFLMSRGYSKTEIATVSKVYGLLATIGGTLAGGALMTKLSLKRALWIFGILQSFAGLSFLPLTIIPKNFLLLVWVLTTENFLIGLGVAAISGFMMKICSRQFTGTQFALLSSLTAISRVVLVSQAGEIAARLGWFWFYLSSVTLALPGLILLTQFDRWIAEPESESSRTLERGDIAAITAFIGGLTLIALEPLFAAVPGLSDVAPYVPVVGVVLFGAALGVGFVRSLG
jgi:PAT family beta-lactamase induction signal transducer AmpG